MRNTTTAKLRPAQMLRATVTLTGSIALLAIGLPAGAVVGDTEPPAEPEGITEQRVAESINSYSMAESIRTFGIEDRVLDLGEPQGEEPQSGVINLSTDLLFAPDKWELPGNASSKIAELIDDVPQDATVQVIGHTDSRPTTDPDLGLQTLSENRAQAVADAIAEERPDLTLEVDGRADEDPAMAEDPEDPDTFAANRRVEINFEGN